MPKHQRYANRKPSKYTHINALSAAGMVYVQPGFTARLPGFGIRRIQHLNNVGVVRDRGLFGGDMKYTIEEIKGLLEGITQGEWETKENGGKGELVGITSPKSNWFIAEEVLKKDASFIAAAPTIIRDLLAEVERLQDEINEARATCYDCEYYGPHKTARLEFQDQLQAAQALAATHLADQELLVARERKKVARECAEICDNIASGYGGHASWAADTIRDRYGVEG